MLNAGRERRNVLFITSFERGKGRIGLGVRRGLRLGYGVDGVSAAAAAYFQQAGKMDDQECPQRPERDRIHVVISTSMHPLLVKHSVCHCLYS